MIPRERPILFSGPMVRAIIDGRKTVTRRVVTSRHPISFVGARGEEHDPACWGYAFDGPRQHGYMVLARGLDERFNHGRVSISCPYGVPGDRLYVREGFAPVDANGHKCSPCEASFVVLPDGAQVYRDGQRVDPLPEYAQGVLDGIKWRPSIHMPRWASRILLEVIDVRVERLHAITEQDAIAEGVSEVGFPRVSFAALWDSINEERASWASNPWVWRVEFRRLS